MKPYRHIFKTESKTMDFNETFNTYSLFFIEYVSLLENFVKYITALKKYFHKVKIYILKNE